MISKGLWPELSLHEWFATRDSLQLWTQIVGKVRMANTPLINHWWNVTLYVNTRGLTTSTIPHRSGRTFEVEFDFNEHELTITVDTGQRAGFPLKAWTVAEFYANFMSTLDSLGLHTRIWPVPVEIQDVIPFDKDSVHSSYDPEYAQRFWRALVQMHRVFGEFRSRFTGKASPVHLFWGALDYAVTRFSGREAPEWHGEVPNCGPHVMLEAYSHEVSSAGYWPGGGGEGTFYSYAYPIPDKYPAYGVRPREANYNNELGEFVLPYDVVRKANDPDAILLEFLQSTYDAAAITGNWNRAHLERNERRA